VRGHQNTLGHLVLVLPARGCSRLLLTFWAAGISILWPMGRVLYALGYYRSFEKGMVGLMISMPPIYIFVLGSIIGFVMKLV
jgi:glutathione S-transferase